LVNAGVISDETESIEVIIKKGDKIFYRAHIDVKNVSSATVVNYMKHYSGDRWQFVVETTNNTYDSTLTGVINIKGPKEFTKRLNKVEVGEVYAGENKKTYFPIPDLLKDDMKFVADLTLSDGSVYDLSTTISFLGIPRTMNPPVIDGVIEAGEWKTGYELQMNEKTNIGIGKANDHNNSVATETYANVIDLIPGDAWSGNDDLSSKIYLAYDDEKLYFAAEVTDDAFVEDPDGRLWAGDSFQLATSLDRSLGAAYTELTIGLIKGKPSIERSSNLVAQVIGAWFDHELAITQSGDKTYYELSIPLTEIYPADFDIREHNALCISLLVNDRDYLPENPNQNRSHLFEYGSGIGTMKNPARYGQFNVIN